MLTLLKKLGIKNASIVINSDPGKFDVAVIEALKARAAAKGYNVRVSYSVTDSNCCTTITVTKEAGK